MGNIVSALTLQSEEAALIAELQAGSEEAFAWLIARFHQPIYSLLARTVYDRADAADLTQEVFVKVFRGVRSFHGESSLRTWIYRIALREASNQRRWWMRHKHQEVAIDQDMTEGDAGTPVRLNDRLVDPSESPFDSVVHAENKARVEAALKQVPEPFRTTLILSDIEGFVYEEVAEMQGVNLGTVKSRLVRGRACLKALLTAPAGCQRPAPSPDLKCPLERRRDERLQGDAGKIYRISGWPVERTRDAADRRPPGRLPGVRPGVGFAAPGAVCRWPAWVRRRSRKTCRCGFVSPSARNGRAAASASSILGPGWKNTVGPFLLQASAGFASAVLLLGTVIVLVTMFAQPEAVQANRMSRSAILPRHGCFIFPAASGKTMSRPLQPGGGRGLCQRRRRGVRLSHRLRPHDEATRAQVENLLLFSVFEPARFFGQPVRGLAVLSFSGVSVRGLKRGTS